FKEFLTYYALENGFSLCYERSYEARVVAKCGRRPPRLSDPEKGKQTKQTRYPSASIDEFHTCPWRWYARWMTDEKTFQCISIEDEHTEYEKTVGEHYAMLRSYGKAILDSNPESTVKLGVIVNPDDKTYFDRFYICFAGLADGWKAGHLDLVFGVVGTRLGLQQRKWANFDGLIEAVKDAMPNAEHRGCEGIENGFSECFNSGIVNVRHKPLLTILNLFKVRSWSEGFTVDEGKRTCSCRMWQLLGIPCVHATKVIFLINRAPESYVPAWFETDMYYVAYQNFVKPVPGMNFWPD
ncbi:pentatricopeptide repeat-containing protein, partial [Tanacetum coccineum]